MDNKETNITADRVDTISNNSHIKTDIEKRFRLIFALLIIVAAGLIVIVVLGVTALKKGSSSGNVQQVVDSLRQENAKLQTHADSIILYTDSLRKDIALLRDERRILNNKISRYDNQLNNLNNELKNISPRYNDLFGDSLRRKFTEYFGN